MRNRLINLSVAVFVGIATFAQAEEVPPPKQVLFTNVKIFNGVDDKLIDGNVLVEGNLIKKIAKGKIKADGARSSMAAGAR
ncbi:MAG: hypothetical protein O7C72_11315 [Deltaproteobacteria bacterium]|nr:hypothetical protein [Deltaproteobacteria bacterium]